jgi:hypothetical protein
VKWRYEANTKPLIGALPGARFGTSQVRAYVEAQQRDGISNATINRELSTVRRGFRLGLEEDPPLVHRVPYILRLEEDNRPPGLSASGAVRRPGAGAADRLKAVFAIAYHVGHSQGRIAQAGVAAGGLRRWHDPPGASSDQGEEGRDPPFFGEMEERLRWQQKRAKPGCRYVFFHGSRPVGAQLDGWREAGEKASVPEQLFHDLRRTGVRNMRIAGVEQSVRMKIPGHKTTSMEQRYNILDQADLKGAAAPKRSHFKGLKKGRKMALKRVKGSRLSSAFRRLSIL